MKGFRLFSAIAAFAVAAVALCANAVHLVVDSLTIAAAKFRTFAAAVFSGPVRMVEANDMRAPVLLKRSAAVKQSMEKRERPVVTASWRMCPSV